MYNMLNTDRAASGYIVGGVNIPAIVDDGYTKVSGTLTGEGEYIKNRYEYRGKELEQAELSEYEKLLQQKYGAMAADTREISEEGSYTSRLYMQTDGERTKVSLSYDGSVYVVDMLAEPSTGKALDSYSPLSRVSAERAREILLSLKKSETGFLAEINVYTIEQQQELAELSGWKYYVFDVVAEYSAKRREPRGTFYVSQDDGMVLRYNKADNTTTLIRKGS